MDRCQKIMLLLTQRKTMSTAQLCDELFCSVSSLRRDLIELEKKGALRRIRGGATLAEATNTDYSFDFRMADHPAEKQYMAEIARDFISNGMSIFLDASSTTAMLCPILGTLQGVTVMTNGLSTALMLTRYPNVKTYVTGGVLNEGSVTLLGEAASKAFDNCKADLAVISCRGIDENGAYEADQSQVHVKQHIIRNAKHSLLLADSSKFGITFMHRLCDFSTLQAVVSDKAPDAQIEQGISAAGCEVLY